MANQLNCAMRVPSIASLHCKALTPRRSFNHLLNCHFQRLSIITSITEQLTASAASCRARVTQAKTVLKSTHRPIALNNCGTRCSTPETWARPPECFPADLPLVTHSGSKPEWRFTVTRLTKIRRYWKQTSVGFANSIKATLSAAKRWRNRRQQVSNAGDRKSVV